MIAKMLLQPRFSVSMPPTKGPIEEPAYTQAMLIPSARPRSAAGKTAVTMAKELTAIIAPATPCMVRQIINIIVEVEKTAATEVSVYIITPKRNIFFKPRISAIRPEGREKTAEARTKEVTIQLKRTASAPNSSLIAGRATFREEDIRVTKITANEEATRAPVFLLMEYYTALLLD